MPKQIDPKDYLTIHARTDRSLLLEDLLHSQTGEADMGRSETGFAVAGWYRSLHEVGREALKHPETWLPGLHAWVDDLTVETMIVAGYRFGLTGKPVRATALQSIEALKIKAQACPQTFHYEDFARENLAFSWGKGPVQAVGFDHTVSP